MATHDGRPHDGLFPPDAIIRRVDGEGVLLLGGGRALLMQLAHPSVAEGVATHSDFRADPFSRLRRTLEASYAIVFGTVEEAERTAAAIRAVHDRVTGPGYYANDPALIMWVHATLVDTTVRVYERFVGRLSASDREDLYRQSMVQASLLGCPESQQPASWREFRSYVRDMVSTLEVSDTARSLAHDVLHPRMPVRWLSEPVMEVARQLTVGLLPRPLREQYGLAWDRPRKLALLGAAAASRTVLPVVPGAVRRAPSRVFA
jgi:uncharacterized protein (DUF2236 family)